MAGFSERERAQDPTHSEHRRGLADKGFGRSEPAEETIELYKAVRAHEVMLNQATSAFEHAVVTRLAALNGGAAGAFLTLLGVLLKANGQQPLETPFAAAAIVAWSAGLLAASFAVWYGLRQQRTTNKGYRILREGLEHYLWPDIGPLVKAPDDEDAHGQDKAVGSHLEPKQDLSNRLAVRRELRAEALTYGVMFNRMVPISAVCFVLGAVFALVAVIG